MGEEPLGLSHSPPPSSPHPMPHRIRIVHFSVWAERVEDAAIFLNRLPLLDLTSRIAKSGDPELLRMARLDCDWHGENSRAFAAMTHPAIEFMPAQVTGAAGLFDLTQPHAGDGVERWLVFDGQGPQKLAAVLGKLIPLLVRNGLRIAWYSFDESSRTTDAFKEIAPFLDLLIHDELPLDPTGRLLLRRNCITLHRSWVANVVPFTVPFNAAPEDKIIFLGSKLGLTDHRKRQIDFLARVFRDRFVPVTDHSIFVAERTKLNRYKASFCPEGRKFTTPAMSQTHTDRPFWSGCMGLIPISENSREGGRLESLAEQRLLRRYSHGSLPELKAACDRALNTSTEDRKRIYDHYNRAETVGVVLAAALSMAVAAAVKSVPVNITSSSAAV